ncbi:hypothetical protein EAG_11750 [Camponotus floridanus]|uniref:Uncharacterized protein n=1 Tax=Camponotus floridanus TaxID=104421 RepID=E2AYH9_CAMFO|nr:hypothetical protein EAG_11750 [Camponotus floridanus]
MAGAGDWGRSMNLRGKAWGELPERNGPGQMAGPVRPLGAIRTKTRGRIEQDKRSRRQSSPMSSLDVILLIDIKGIPRGGCRPREEGSCGSDEEYPERVSRSASSSARPPLHGATVAGIVIAIHPRRGVGRSAGLHVENDVGLFLLVLLLLLLLSLGPFLAVGVLGQAGGRRCASSTRRSCPARVAVTAVAAAAAGTVDRRLASIHGLRMQQRRRWPATCHRGRLRSSTYPTRGGRDYTHPSTTCGGPVPHPACDTVRPGDTIAAARHYRDLGRPSRATTSPTRHTRHQPTDQPLTTSFGLSAVVASSAISPLFLSQPGH